MKSLLRLIVKWAVALVISLAAVALGAAFGTRIPNSGAWHFLLFAVLLVCVALSALLSFVWGRKLEKLKVQDHLDLREVRSERMERNEKQERRRLEIAYWLTVAYLVFLVTVSLGESFFCGASGSGIGSMQLLSVYVLYGIVGRFFRKKQEKPDFSKALPRKDFPELYSVVEEAAGAAAEHNRIHIFVSDNVPDEECNMGVSQIGRDIWLIVGTVLLCVLGREELKQALRHEFAHLENNDIHQLVRFNRLMNFLTNDEDEIMGLWASLALRFPVNYLAYEGTFYFMLSSRQKEEAADAQAMNLGDRQVITSALAKISAYNLFIYERTPYENIFGSEQIPQHFATDRAKAYRNALEKRWVQWKQILEHELPAKSASHPTFRQRWEILGCCDYSMMPAALDDAYGAECWAAGAVCDRQRASVEPEHYAAMRKESYLDHDAVIRSFESAQEVLAPEEMRPVMIAYYAVGQPEKMEALCDQIIRSSDSAYATAFSRYWKGILLLHRYDAAGINYIYQAIEANRNYIKEGLDEIGRFCTLMGLESELEEYRRRAPEFFQTKVDWDSGRGITAKANLRPEQLPDGWLDRICGYILDSAQGSISHVYLVHEIGEPGCEMSSFILRFDENADQELADEVYDRVFRLLDDWPQDWEFSLYTYEPSMEKVLQKVHGACVYSKDDDRKAET